MWLYLAFWVLGVLMTASVVDTHETQALDLRSGAVAVPVS